MRKRTNFEDGPRDTADPWLGSWLQALFGSPTRWFIALSIFVLGFGGCASDRWALQRSMPLNPLVRELELDSRAGPQPTARTMQLLRKHDLADELEDSPERLVHELQKVAYQDPSAGNVYSIAEVAYIAARRLEEEGECKNALDLYATAAANAYFYLFDMSFGRGRTPYDPRFRRACDIYNSALESTLRFIHKLEILKPGGVLQIDKGEQSFEFQIATRGTWHEQNFGELKFVSDFQVQTLKNVYRTFGLGVPLIAVYEPHQIHAADSFYPPGMSFPVTAFMRIVDSATDTDGRIRHRCIIELHDPMVDSNVTVGDRSVPLETELTTPLAYSLDNPTFRQANDSIQSIRQPDQSLGTSAVYMLEPYDSRKMPVVMVHGLFSNLVTWMEMFNDLRGDPEIRENFQFWFYLYPTGVPPWFTAAHLREQLIQSRNTLDPYHQDAVLDQMILVGHSMGGLLSKLQVQQSGDRIWSLVSDRPLSELAANPNDLSKIQHAFFFEPNPSVKRIITIASPFKGSKLSNNTTQWLSRQVFNLPHMLLATQERLVSSNPGFFPAESLAFMDTSVNALAPDSALLRFIDETPIPTHVKHHNIIGVVQQPKPLKAVTSQSDGVVAVASARAANAVSEITVNSDHVNVHRHPLAILEVRRILLEHLAEVQAGRPSANLASAGHSATK